MFDPEEVVRVVRALQRLQAVAAYMLSRGIAQSGSRSRSHDPREDLDFGKDKRD
jgi:hypothetical protein